ncbi:MAG: hypothetical protein K9L85_03650 [Candidatus Peribacteraceae bacterium]|nr:hypothetical protein [Candidatus Peribacteraceae bacterium]
MNSKSYLLGLAILAALGWIALTIVVLRLDPFTSTALAVPFFLAALFMALTGTFALAGFYFRVWFRRGEIYLQHISISLRQAIFLTIAVEVALIFQILRILTWWDGVLIAAAVSLVEIYFSSKD